MGKMTTTDLIDAIAAATGQSKSDVGKVLDSFKAVATTALNQGTDVPLNGFGTFKAKHRAARHGRNPRTGETVEIAASNTVGFTAAKALKDALN